MKKNCVTILTPSKRQLQVILVKFNDNLINIDWELDKLYSGTSSAF